MSIIYDDAPLEDRIHRALSDTFKTLSRANEMPWLPKWTTGKSSVRTLPPSATMF